LFKFDKKNAPIEPYFSIAFKIKFEMLSSLPQMMSRVHLVM